MLGFCRDVIRATSCCKFCASLHLNPVKLGFELAMQAGFKRSIFVELGNWD
jgi:hypothetical protein